MAEEARYRSVKLTLYPNEEQKRQIERNLYVQRYVINACIYYVKYVKRRTGRLPTQFDLNRLCTEIWQKNPWMHDGIYQNSLNYIAKRVLDSCKAGFAKDEKYKPRYKKQEDMRSFGYLSNKTFSVSDIMDNGKMKRYVKLGKFKQPIRARNMMEITGTPVTCTVGRNRDVNPEYWCVIQVREPYSCGELCILDE